MQAEFERILGADNVKINEPMKNHTTFKIGGCADYFLTPENESGLTELLKTLNKSGMPFFVLGNGSNVLFGDKGFRGAVICLYKKVDKVSVSGTVVSAQCGALLSKVAKEALGARLSGFEFASGIPGTVGGGVFMNAGAYGFELKDVIGSVRCVDKTGKAMVLSADECKFGYRKSIFSEKELIVTECEFLLKKGSEEEIKSAMNDYAKRRSDKQPLSMPSAGSTFKRPAGHFAGGLIEQAGLKGCSVGGAQVSEKHAGFIVNTGGATASDVLGLIELVKKDVMEKFGVELEPEVRLVGEF